MGFTKKRLNLEHSFAYVAYKASNGVKVNQVSPKDWKVVESQVILTRDAHRIWQRTKVLTTTAGAVGVVVGLMVASYSVYRLIKKWSTKPVLIEYGANGERRINGVLQNTPVLVEGTPVASREWITYPEIAPSRFVTIFADDNETIIRKDVDTQDPNNWQNQYIYDINNKRGWLNPNYNPNSGGFRQHQNRPQSRSSRSSRGSFREPSEGSSRPVTPYSQTSSDRSVQSQSTTHTRSSDGLLDGFNRNIDVIPMVRNSLGVATGTGESIRVKPCMFYSAGHTCADSKCKFRHDGEKLSMGQIFDVLRKGKKRSCPLGNRCSRANSDCPFVHQRKMGRGMLEDKQPESIFAKCAFYTSTGAKCQNKTMDMWNDKCNLHQVRKCAFSQGTMSCQLDVVGLDQRCPEHMVLERKFRNQPINEVKETKSVGKPEVLTDSAIFDMDKMDLLDEATFQVSVPGSTVDKVGARGGFLTSDGLYTTSHDWKKEMEAGLDFHIRVKATVVGDKTIYEFSKDGSEIIINMKGSARNECGSHELGNLIRFNVPGELSTFRRLTMSSLAWDNIKSKHIFMLTKTPDRRFTSGDKLVFKNAAGVVFPASNLVSKEGNCGYPWVDDKCVVYGAHIGGWTESGINGLVRKNMS